MANLTNQDAINLANPNSIADLLRQIPAGDLIAGMIPRVISRTVASNAVQVEPEAGAILSVADAAGTSALAIVTGTPGAGEVQIAYSAEGVATLTFASPVTGYQVVKTVLPAGLATYLAADTGAF